MLAFWKRECRSYFYSPVGYVLMAGMLCMVGIHTYMICILGRMPVFEDALSSSALIFLLMVPILTMRTFSEERRDGVLQFFYSMPVRLSNVVLGKYFALLTVLMLPLLFCMIYPLVLSWFGSMNYGIIASTFVGFFAMGAALIAIGVFFSALVENQVAASAVTFVVLLVSYFIPTLAAAVPSDAFTTFVALAAVILLLALICYLASRNSVAALSFALICCLPLCIVYRLAPDFLNGGVSTILRGVSVYARFVPFREGVLDLTTLVYYVSLSALMLFLAVQVLEYRRCR